MGSLKILLLLIVATANAELEGLLNSLPADVLNLGQEDAKLKPSDTFSTSGEEKFSKSTPFGQPLGSPIKGKILKAAAVVPAKKVAVKTAATKLAKPKLKVAALKAKPKVYSLKPIVHVIEKPVPVYHKVPVPKKVIVPKFYPVIKPIPVPKIVPVPYKVPVKKVIPKIVKIPKAVLIPKIVPVKKPVPIPIPYPVPKIYKVPIPKPVPYKKYIPIPIPKKVPKYIPVPVKKVIKVPKPFYVPVKVPHVTTSYIKTPMVVDVPDVKKLPTKGKFDSFNSPKMSLKSGNKQEEEFLKSILGNMDGKDPLFEDSLANLGSEDKELLKMLTNSMPGGKV